MRASAWSPNQSRTRTGLRLIAASLVLGLATTSMVALPAQVAGAAPTATVTDCSGSVSDTGSLPYAVLHATSGETITFAPAVTSCSPIVVTSTIDIAVNLTIDGPGPGSLAVSGGNAVGVFSVSPGITATIAGLTIENGYATSGGGVLNEGTLAIDDSTLWDNNASVNGGGGVWSNGTLTVSDSTLSTNTSTVDGGGVMNAGGVLNVNDSTFADNSAIIGGGGGVFNELGQATVGNSTFSGNNANVAGGGGGFLNGGSSTLHLTDSTFSGNGANAIFNDGAEFIGSTIVANGNSGANCQNVTAITDLGYNLEDDAGASCGFSSAHHDIVGQNPDLGTLENNGGPTQTMALLTGSPAVDKVPAAQCPATDQRGVPRTAPCDIGAYDTDFPNFSTFSPTCATGTAYYLYASSSTGDFVGLFCVDANGDGTYDQYSLGPPAVETLEGTGHVRLESHGVITLQASGATPKNFSLVGTTNGTSSSFSETGSGLVNKTGTFTLATVAPTPADDTTVEANVRNGLVDAVTAYEIDDQSYSGALAVLPSIDSRFSWTSATTSCTTFEPTCISVDSVDVATPGDQQGVILAAMTNTGNCYWIANLEAAAVVVPSTGFLLNATVGDSGNESVGSPPQTITSSGTYYAKKSGPGAAADCNAAYPMTASAGFNWGTNLSAPGSAG